MRNKKQAIFENAFDDLGPDDLDQSSTVVDINNSLVGKLEDRTTYAVNDKYEYLLVLGINGINKRYRDTPEQIVENALKVAHEISAYISGIPFFDTYDDIRIGFSGNYKDYKLANQWSDTNKHLIDDKWYLINPPELLNLPNELLQTTSFTFKINCNIHKNQRAVNFLIRLANTNFGGLFNHIFSDLAAGNVKLSIFTIKDKDDTVYLTDFKNQSIDNKYDTAKRLQKLILGDDNDVVVAKREYYLKVEENVKDLLDMMRYKDVYYINETDNEYLVELNSDAYCNVTVTPEKINKIIKTIAILTGKTIKFKADRVLFQVDLQSNMATKNPFSKFISNIKKYFVPHFKVFYLRFSGHQYGDVTLSNYINNLSTLNLTPFKIDKLVLDERPYTEDNSNNRIIDAKKNCPSIIKVFKYKYSGNPKIVTYN